MIAGADLGDGASPVTKDGYLIDTRFCFSLVSETTDDEAPLPAHVLVECAVYARDTDGFAEADHALHISLTHPADWAARSITELQENAARLLPGKILAIADLLGREAALPL